MGSRRSEGLALSRPTSGLLTATARAGLRTRRAVAVPLVAAAEILFDRMMGIRTRGEQRNEAELAPIAVGGDPIRYAGAHLFLWWRWIGKIPLDRGRTTFIDLGAGRGRALVLAAEMGFRRAIGVELDERLVRDAEENIRRWRRKRRPTKGTEPRVTIVHGDAATYTLPDGPIVLSLYNPFGATTLRHVLRQATERPANSVHPLFVAYINPVHREVFDEFPRLGLYAHAKRWAVYRLEPTGPQLTA
jgi:SAM-dependent methyltransferase